MRDALKLSSKQISLQINNEPTHKQIIILNILNEKYRKAEIMKKAKSALNRKTVYYYLLLP